jgi:hypothetical protein
MSKKHKLIFLEANFGEEFDCLIKLKLIEGLIVVLALVSSDSLVINEQNADEFDGIPKNKNK